MKVTHKGYDIMLAAAQILGKGEYGKATAGGNQITLIDAGLPVYPADDTDNGGIIFIADEDFAGRIVDWDASTYKWTFEAGHTGNTAIGDLYFAFDKTYTYHDLLAAANEVIRVLPPLPYTWEDAAFVTVADQKQYDVLAQPEMPVLANEITAIWIANSTDAPYDYEEYPYWDHMNGKLEFWDGKIPAIADRRIKFMYPYRPSALSDHQSTLDGIYHIDWVAWETAKVALRNRLKKTEGHSKFVIADYEATLQTAAKMRARHRKNIPRLMRQPKPHALSAV